MHSGATAAKREGLTNVAFIRTSIELLERFFAPGEVADIWITFPDPQMQKVNKRLTGTRFCSMYRRVAAPGCLVRLKSDSPFLYTYTERMARENGLRIAADTADLYAPTTSSSGSTAASPSNIWHSVSTATRNSPSRTPTTYPATPTRATPAATSRCRSSSTRKIKNKKSELKNTSLRLPSWKILFTPHKSPTP